MTQVYGLQVITKTARERNLQIISDKFNIENLDSMKVRSSFQIKRHGHKLFTDKWGLVMRKGETDFLGEDGHEWT
jgi:hypothetical protein